MLGDAFQADIDKALDAQAARPLTPPKPPTRFKDSVWAQPIRGLAAGLGDMLAGGSELAVGMYRQSRAMDTQDPVERKRQQEQGVPFDGATDFSRDLRKVAAGYRPDPATAGAAENIVFGLSRVIPKAVGYTLAGGPVLAAAALGTDEALTTHDELTAKGVDNETANKVAAITGVASGAGILLPMAGSTVAKTAGLYAVGGPGAFVAQQAATREILSKANYGDLAKQYDPLDPVGLALSALIPLPFAAWGVRANVKGAKAVEPPAPRIEPTLQPEQIDATMVHNLTLARDAHDASAARPVPTADDPFIAALPAEQRQAMSDLYAAAAREKPGFDTALIDLASEAGATLKLADLKRPERAVAKVQSDYGGDPTKIKDLLRATIEVDSVDSAQRAVAGVFERFEVLPTGRRNLLDPTKEPVDGYRDAKFNVLINGHVAEIQVNVPEMMRAKKEGGHKLYVERDTLIRDVNAEPMSPDVEAKLAQIGDLNERMRNLYSAAWAEATKARNSASPIGAPFRRADEPSNTRGGLVSQAADTGAPMTAAQDTGMPSTSKNSARGSNLAGSASEAGDSRFISTSDPILRENPAQVGAAVQAAKDLAASGKSLEAFAADGKFAPDVQNLLIGIHEAGGDGARVARMLSDFQRTTDAQPGRSPVDIAADVVEASRSGGTVTAEPKPAEAATATTPEKAVADSITNRLAVLEKEAPNLVVRIADDGTPVTLADELATIRREAAEGTDSTLGSNDAPLLQVAAECALSTGA